MIGRRAPRDLSLNELRDLLILAGCLLLLIGAIMWIQAMWDNPPMDCEDYGTCVEWQHPF